MGPIPLKNDLGKATGLNGWLALLRLSASSGAAASGDTKRAGQRSDKSDKRVRVPR